MDLGSLGGLAGNAIGTTVGWGLGKIDNSASKAKRSETRNYNFQREMQDKQLAWEREKFNNQYQAAVKDLEKAGLNPVMAAMNGGNTAGSISGGAGTDIAGQAAISNSQNLSQGIIAGLDRMENARVNTSVIDSNNAQAALSNVTTELRKKEAGWLDKRQAKELKKLDFDMQKTQKETDLMEQQRYKQMYTMEADIRQAFGNAARTVSEGYIAQKDAEALQTIGFSRKELMQLGEFGLKLIGNLINLRAGINTAREVAQGIIKNNKLRGQTPMRRNRGSWDGYTPSPYDRFAADRQTYENWYKFY